MSAEKERFYTAPSYVLCDCNLKKKKQYQKDQKKRERNERYEKEWKRTKKRQENEKENEREKERLERLEILYPGILEREKLEREKEKREKEKREKERLEKEQKEKRDNENLLNFMKYEFSNNAFSFKSLRLKQLQNLFIRLKPISNELVYTLTSLSEVIKDLEKSDSNVLQHCNSLIALRLVCDQFKPSEVCFLDPRVFKQFYFVEENLVESVRYLIFYKQLSANKPLHRKGFEKYKTCKKVEYSYRRECAKCNICEPSLFFYNFRVLRNNLISCDKCFTKLSYIYDCLDPVNKKIEL
jgi:hypothetical protein